MAKNNAVLVLAHLSGPIAGDAPQLDALLEMVLSIHHPKGVEGYKVDRQYPCLPPNQIPIPLMKHQIGDWLVACCSSPIYDRLDSEGVEHVGKRIGVEHAGLLEEHERKVVATTNSWTKSYRLPLRIRHVNRIAWIAQGDRSDLLHVLKRVSYLGKKRAHGYGQVREWTVERFDHPAWWYADHEAGRVLMRPLPLGNWLPSNLIGYRRDFGACVPPYWHPDRYGEVVVPC